MMKKLTYLFLIISCMVQYSYAQNSGSATLNVRASATVTDNLQMLTLRHLDLINPAILENKVVVSPITSSYAGLFKILGNPKARVRITFLQNEIIEEANDGVGVVYAEYFLSAAIDDIQMQSMLLDVGEVVIQIGANGELYIWLGANLDLSKASPGVYLSEFIIELEYI